MNFKYQNGAVIQYDLKVETKIDMAHIIQKLVSLSETLYDETIDCVEASYKLNGILDDLIEFKDV